MPGCDVLLAKTIEHQLHERLPIFVTPNVDDLDTFGILHGHCEYGQGNDGDGREVDWKVRRRAGDLRCLDVLQ